MSDEAAKRERMLNAMLGGQSIRDVMEEEQRRTQTAAPAPFKQMTMEERMKSIINSAAQTKASTDQGNLPAGFAEYAKQKNLSVDDQAGMLAMMNRVATGGIKMTKHSDGNGFDMTFH